MKNKPLKKTEIQFNLHLAIFLSFAAQLSVAAPLEQPLPASCDVAPESGPPSIRDQSLRVSQICAVNTSLEALIDKIIIDVEPPQKKSIAPNEIEMVKKYISDNKNNLSHAFPNYELEATTERWFFEQEVIRSYFSKIISIDDVFNYFKGKNPGIAELLKTQLPIVRDMPSIPNNNRTRSNVSDIETPLAQAQSAITALRALSSNRYGHLYMPLIKRYSYTLPQVFDLTSRKAREEYKIDHQGNDPDYKIITAWGGELEAMRKKFQVPKNIFLDTAVSSHFIRVSCPSKKKRSP